MRPIRGVSGNPDFPRHGKNGVAFSTSWKNIFHTVENPDDPNGAEI